MPTHIMVDLETLDFKPSSVILTLGAIKFDPYSNAEPYDPLYLRFDIDGQTAIGRTISESTIEWWGQQEESVREEALGEKGRVSVEDGIDQFHKFVWNSDAIWAQGPQFDIVIIENLYQMLDKSFPWRHGQVKDSRTLFTLGVDPELQKGDQAHNALVDAYWQAKGVQNVYRKLGLKNSR